MSSTLTKPLVGLGLLDVFMDPSEACKSPALALAAHGKGINNIANSSETERENFLIAMVRPLVMYGAPLNLLEEKLLEAAHHFNVKVTVYRKPGEFSCVLGEYGNPRRKIIVNDNGRRQFRPIGVVQVDTTLSAVVNDDLRMKEAVALFGNMEKRGPLTHALAHVACAAALSAFLCMHAFHASGREVVYTFMVTFMLCVLHLLCKRAGPLLIAFLETTITVLVSLFAHDSHIHANIIVGVLPGYLHLCNLMKTTDTNGGTTVQGYLRTTFAITYALSLKSGLPILLDIVLMAKLVALVYLGKHVYSRVAKTGQTTVKVTRHRTPKILQKALEATVDQ